MTKLEKIKAKLAAILAQFSVVKTDKAILVYDGDELVAGMPVFVENEEKERTAVEDGEYTTEDGKVITVKEGVVESIVDPAAEVEAEDEEPKEEEPKEGEKLEEEPKDGEEPVEGEEPKEGDEPKEDEKLEEEPVENEEPKEDAIAELRKEVDELYKLVDSILDKIGETRREADERLTKIEKMSAAAPAAAEIEADLKLSTISDKRAKRIADMNRDWRN